MAISGGGGGGGWGLGGNPSDKGKTLGEGKAGTFPLLAISSNYYMISFISFPVYLLSSHCIIPKFCSLSFVLFLLSVLHVPILLYFYRIDCLPFHLDRDSALLITLNGKTNEHLDMLNSGIIYRLLEEKWTTFARVRIKTMSPTYCRHAMRTDRGIKELCHEIKIQTVGNATILSET